MWYHAPSDSPCIWLPDPMTPSKRSEIRPFLVMDLLDRANAYQTAGRDIVHMEAGQPGTPAPALVREAAKTAIEQELIGYTEALGMPALRQRIAKYYVDTYGVDVSPDRVVITTGSSAAFMLSFLASFDTGARVGIGAPYYPAYPNILSGLGYEPVIMETGAEDNYQISEDLLTRQRDKLDGLLVASPANPTGAMIGADALRQLVLFCKDNAIKFISDEIYHGITYAEPAHSALEFSDEVIVINSFSKFFSMTGWRIGWMIVPDQLVRAVERLSQNFYISVPAVSQIAAMAAFDELDTLRGFVRNYARNRDYLLAELPKLGLADIAPADGAFYLYTDISHIDTDSLGFCMRMLDEIGVACTPGMDFDTGARAAKIRFSYAGPHDDAQETIRRLKDWLPSP